ncbi:MerR family transcriptional regulator [Mammaliicoccus sciuri]|uniref:MerR family transcriptional regulator n=1 Tax=Mammaliicoccus sciuri TaxID=1296 RepID=UPI0028886D74|nr:MerR family transcriptional regulator [Mammaliicoccus sciuri]MDT0703783.1 MerR family transcriptional regulator [Mammaliicoccus sciuri]
MQMTTGQVAKVCHVTVRTVQYYDKKGIVIPSETSENNRRLYTEADLNQLKIVLILKDMNFSLKEIKALLKSNESINTLNVLLSEKIIELEENIRNESDQLKQIQFIKKNISEESEYPVSNILNLKNKSKKHQLMKKFRSKFMFVSMIVGIGQYTSIAMAITKKKWKPVIIVYPFVLLYAAFAVKKYYAVVSYLCPNCQNEFKPFFSEWFKSNHTYQTRKLLCPHCNVESFCIETHE